MGNLPWSTTGDDLAEAFAAHGKVISSRIITDRETGRSRGFGFVDAEDEDVENMVSALNNTQIAGRTIVVKIAEKQKGE